MKESLILGCCIVLWLVQFSMQCHFEGKFPCNCGNCNVPCHREGPSPCGIRDCGNSHCGNCNCGNSSGGNSWGNCKGKLVPVPGYVFVQGLGYYKVHSVYTDWETAVNKCYSEGANLLIINSDAEARAVTQLMKQSSTFSFGHWTGTCRNSTTGAVSTIPADTPRQPLFTQRYPVGDTGDCGTYVAYTQHGIYYQNCKFQQPSVCEAEL